MIKYGTVIPRAQASHHPQWAVLMRRAGILTGGVVALILLAVVCMPRYRFLPPPHTAVAPVTTHTSLEQGRLVFRGSFPYGRHRTSIQPNHRIALLM